MNKKSRLIFIKQFHIVSCIEDAPDIGLVYVVPNLFDELKDVLKSHIRTCLDNQTCGINSKYDMKNMFFEFIDDQIHKSKFSDQIYEVYKKNTNGFIDFICNNNCNPIKFDKSIRNIMLWGNRVRHPELKDTADVTICLSIYNALINDNNIENVLYKLKANRYIYDYEVCNDEIHIKINQLYNQFSISLDKSAYSAYKELYADLEKYFL